MVPQLTALTSCGADSRLSRLLAELHSWAVGRSGPKRGPGRSRRAHGFQHTGGEYFSFTLRVVDVAGQESATSTHTVTRLTTPAPIVTIAAPTATLILGAGELLLLQAKAQLVSCNGTEKGQVAFNWSCTDSTSGAALPLPGASVTRSTLELRGALTCKKGQPQRLNQPTLVIRPQPTSRVLKGGAALPSSACHGLVARNLRYGS